MTGDRGPFAGGEAGRHGRVDLRADPPTLGARQRREGR